MAAKQTPGSGLKVQASIVDAQSGIPCPGLELIVPGISIPYSSTHQHSPVLPNTVLRQKNRLPHIVE